MFMIFIRMCIDFKGVFMGEIELYEIIENNNLNNSFLGATYVTSANGKEIPISKSFHVIFDLNA